MSRITGSGAGNRLATMSSPQLARNASSTLRPISAQIWHTLIAYELAEQLYACAVEGVGDLVSEAQREIGAATPAESQGDRSISRAT
jgi:hypothetical protein